MNGQINLGKNPLGPVERRINLIKLQRPDGSPIALIANYPIHGTVLGYYANYGIGNTLISGDLQGVVAEYVEGQIGAPLLFIQGAAGNIAPIYTKAVDEKRGNVSSGRFHAPFRLAISSAPTRTKSSSVFPSKRTVSPSSINAIGPPFSHQQSTEFLT